MLSILHRKMYAAINRSQKTVWGIGETESQAIADAHNELASKTDDIKKIGMAPLVVVKLKNGAPINDRVESGYSLYKHCELNKQQTHVKQQADIFSL